MNTRFGWHSPLVLKDCIATTQTHAGRTTGKLDDQGCAVLMKGDGTVKQTISATNTDAALRPGEAHFARSCQPAITNNGEILLYYPANSSNAAEGGILYCYDDESVKQTTTVAPDYKWRKEIPGYLSSTVTSSATAATECGGHGAALDSDGNIYVTTRTSLVALSASGDLPKLK